jgi:hypothetical protein
MVAMWVIQSSFAPIFSDLETLSLPSHLLLLVSKQVPLEFIGQIFQTKLSTRPRYSNATR